MTYSTTFISSFQSEWLKKKHTLAVWLVLIGSFFTPAIELLIALTHRDKLVKQYADPNFWTSYWIRCWQPMSFMLLPLGVILATSLVTQLEFKNNTWKQLHASPLSLTTIFFSKLAVLLVMMIQLFLLFNLFTYLTGVIPTLVFSEVSLPATAIPLTQILKHSALIFFDCLPILLIQYILSLQFKNFMVPVGAGMAVWLLGTLALSWKYSFIFPYLYSAYEEIVVRGGKLSESAPNFHLVAGGYSLAALIVGYVLYIRKPDKG